MSQGLLLWLLLSPSAVWASRSPLRPLCQPINATLAAENEACPVCITFTTSICAGYCPSMVSAPNGLGPHFSQSTITSARPKTGGGSGAKGVAVGQRGWHLGRVTATLGVWKIRWTLSPVRVREHS